jgi:TonB-linked SusC/RagA family outer membrane protein
MGRRWLKPVFTLLLVSAPLQWANAQITLNNRKTQLRTVIQKIKQQTKYEFFLDDKLASSTVPAIQVSNASIQEVLSRLLAGKDVTYRIEGNVVYLKKKGQEHPSSIEPQQKGKAKTSPHKVTGTIVDEHQDPLIGATVSVKGTNEKTITDLDGNYIITTDEANPVLLVSYIGYQSKELRVSGDKADITLTPDAKSLNEVVVTALGIKRAQKALSYNVQQVSGEELATNKDANFINSLSGKVAGVNINASSSGAGSAAKVVLRGTRSIEQSSNVLYVIDGVPMINQGGEGSTEFGSGGVTEAIADINPDDIESMSVLTGAAAAALYGNKASNGAIVITTKKGKVGKIELTVSQTTEISSAFRMPEFQNRYGTGSSLNEQGAASYSWGKLLNDANRFGYDLKDDFLRNGVMSNESFTLSTGSEHNQTFLSASMLNSGGILPNNKYNRYNFTIRNTTSFLNDKMTLDLGASYIIQNDRNMTNQGVYANPLVTAYLFPRGNDFEDVKMFEYYDTQDKIYKQNWNGLISEMVGQNPCWVSYRNRRDNKKYRYMMSAGLTYKLLPWMSLSGRVRIDNANNKYEQKYYATTNQTPGRGKWILWLGQDR